MNIDRYWLREGQWLGLRFIVDSKPQTVWYHVEGREWSDYPFAFASAAASAATGWIDLQDSSNRYVLQPRRRDVIFHYFLGIWPSTSILYTQFPTSVDRMALTGNRVVDANAIGGIRGTQSPLSSPSVKTEFFSISDLRPVFNAFNGDQNNSQTQRVHIYAVQYMVSGPFAEGSAGVPPATQLQDMVVHGKARTYSMYGIQLQQIPQDQYDFLAKNAVHTEDLGGVVNMRKGV